MEPSPGFRIILFPLTTHNPSSFDRWNEGSNSLDGKVLGDNRTLRILQDSEFKNPPTGRFPQHYPTSELKICKVPSPPPTHTPHVTISRYSRSRLDLARIGARNPLQNSLLTAQRLHRIKQRPRACTAPLHNTIPKVSPDVHTHAHAHTHTCARARSFNHDDNDAYKTSQLVSFHSFSIENPASHRSERERYHSPVVP